MKKLFLLILVVASLFILAQPVLAQELPDTAVEALKQAEGILVALGIAFAGFVGFTITDFLKEKVPGLAENVANEVGAWITRVVAFVTSTAAGLLVSLVVDYAAKLDETGLWKAIVTIVLVFGSPVAAELLHRLRRATGGS
jgi:hypothetical protein